MVYVSLSRQSEAVVTLFGATGRRAVEAFAGVPNVAVAWDRFFVNLLVLDEVFHVILQFWERFCTVTLRTLRFLIT